MSHDKKIKVSEKELAEIVDKEIDDLFLSFKTERKEVLLILQFHLHIENILERIIISRLERGDKLIEIGNLTFNQKLCIVDSFSIIDDRYIDSLRKINKLRNDCAHVKSAQISQQNIDLIGRPLGKKYTQIMKEEKGTLEQKLQRVLAAVGAKLISGSLLQEYDPEYTKENKGV